MGQTLKPAGNVDILDGLQRTYIIKDLKKEGHVFVEGQTLLVEFWLEGQLSNLIYRIIVLNAGQKPMSIRHQVELLFMSLKTSIEQEVENLELYTERDNTRRHRARKFSLSTVSAAYQAFITKSPELQRDNVIANQLLESNALDASEEEVTQQFTDFSKYLTKYADLDEHVARIYRPARLPLEDVPVELEERAQPAIHGGAYANWLAGENVMMGFFAAAAQYAGSDAKTARVDEALRALIGIAAEAPEGADPLGLAVFEQIRAGNNPRRTNVGLATRKLLTNGFKEFFRDSGETPLADCWPIAAD